MTLWLFSSVLESERMLTSAFCVLFYFRVSGFGFLVLASVP